MSKRILVVGDAILDKYLFGVINRQSPEDSTISIIDVEKEEYRLGGCLNVAVNIKSLSKNLFDVFVSSVFSHFTGRKISDAGIRCDDFCINAGSSFVPCPSELIKTRIINQETKKQIVRIDNRLKFKDEDIELYKESLGYNLEEFDAIVVSDYQKGLVDDFILDKLKDYKGQVFVDTKNPDLSFWDEIENCFIKVNLIESQKRKSTTKHPIIVTTGKDGAALLGLDELNLMNFYKKFTIEPIENADVTGAGDVFLAGLVVEYLRTEKIEYAIKFANKYARKSVMTKGTTQVYPDDY